MAPPAASVRRAKKSPQDLDYHMVGADLRDVKELESMLIANGVDFRYVVIVIARLTNSLHGVVY